MLQCYLNSYFNNRNLKSALKNCAFQRVGAFHKRLDVQNNNFCCCVRQVNYFIIFFLKELYHGHKTLREFYLFLSTPSPLPWSANSEWGKAPSHAHGRAGSLHWWTLRQERGLIFLSANSKPHMKSTLFHSPSEITKVSQLQGLPRWLLGQFLSEQTPKQNKNNLQHRLSLSLQLLLHFRRQTVLKDCRLLLQHQAVPWLVTR